MARPIVSEGPRYKHCCRHCIFLGSSGEFGTHYDLYSCSLNGGELVARSGDGPNHYIAGAGWPADEPEHPLAQAAKKLILAMREVSELNEMGEFQP